MGRDEIGFRDAEPGSEIALAHLRIIGASLADRFGRRLGPSMHFTPYLFRMSLPWRVILSR
jgi:hypothetical protein